MHCISLAPSQKSISAILCRFVCSLSPTLASMIQFLYVHMITEVQRIFNQVSWTFGAMQCILSPILFVSIISKNSRRYKAPRLLSQINAISSPSCVFKLQNPIVLHSRIVPNKKLKNRRSSAVKMTHNPLKTIRG